VGRGAGRRACAPLVLPEAGRAHDPRGLPAHRSGRGRGLAGHAPEGIERLADEPYGDGPDAVLDVYHRTGARCPAPTIVWVHGGAFVGGSKEELRHWFELLADAGYTVVAPRYSLAPESTYPTPVRQVMAVLGHVCAHAGRLRVDPHRLVLAGDSAGAQLAAQVATLVTSPVYAEQVGIEAHIGGGSAPWDRSLLRCVRPVARRQGPACSCTPRSGRTPGRATSQATRRSG
jgi:acetyl esterase/lipase